MAHIHRGDKYVPVMIDLTAVGFGTGPVRLLDKVEGRSKEAFKTRLAARPKAWRDGVEVVSLDGFTGLRTAAAEELPDAATVMDSFHVIRLIAEALDEVHRRVQQDSLGRRGHAGDSLYAARRLLLTGADLLTDQQRTRLHTLFDGDTHVQVQATWSIYDKAIAAYRDTDWARGRATMTALIEDLRDSRPGRAGRAAPARADPATASSRRAGLLRPARHIQQPHRGD